jgi:hypothetical protein
VDFNLYWDELVDLETFLALATEKLNVAPWPEPPAVPVGLAGVVDQVNRQNEERFVKQQRQAGFTYVFSLGIVRLWSLLEALVDDLVLEQIQRPEVIAEQVALKLKGPLIEFWKATDAERHQMVLDRLKTERLDDGTEKPKNAVDRLEALLKKVSLKGEMDRYVRDALTELCTVRNILVHRNGVADRHLNENCPWLELNPGVTLAPQHQEFFIYGEACRWYMSELQRRLDPSKDGDGTRRDREFRARELEVMFAGKPDEQRDGMSVMVRLDDDSPA